MIKNRFPWTDHYFPQIRNKTRWDHRWRLVLKVSGCLLAAGFVFHLLLILLLRWIQVPTSAFMVWHSFGDESIHYQWVDWKQISPQAAIAVVAAEDQNFISHWGFDFKAIAEALDENKTRGQPRGASTISQQVAKNLFLWSGRSWIRKGLEAYLTVLIECLWSKQRILEVYLNIAQFGPDTYGVGAASRMYFQRPAAKLNSRQAALLAAVLPNPVQMRVDRPSEYVRQRAGQIVEQVELLGGTQYLASLFD